MIGKAPSLDYHDFGSKSHIFYRRQQQKIGGSRLRSARVYGCSFSKKQHKEEAQRQNRGQHPSREEIVFSTQSVQSGVWSTVYYNYNQSAKAMQSRRGWSEIEDDRLLKIIKKYGTKNWSLVSDKLSVGTTFERTGKQCRERWHNHLNPNINHQDWTRAEDQKMFEAHRQCGSKWKEISKQFPGRTDNSIKNHFYSTVRKCLRTIGKAKGDRHNSIAMKTIKPSVLSKIVQNPELMGLIMEIGNGKYKESNSANISASVVDRICEELKLVSSEYQSKNKQNSELTKKLGASSSSHSLNSLSQQAQERLEPLTMKKEVEKQPFLHQQVPMKQFFDEFDSHHHDRSEFIETHIECREKADNNLRDIFLFPAIHQAQQVKEESHLKPIPFENYANQEDCIYEEYESNFFVSPSCNKKKAFPELRLFGKLSKNSHPSPSCSSKHEDRPSMAAARHSFFREDEEELEINFDPHEFMNEGQEKGQEPDES